jgi:hypothetical protein
MYLLFFSNKFHDRSKFVCLITDDDIAQDLFSFLQGVCLLLDFLPEFRLSFSYFHIPFETKIYSSKIKHLEKDQNKNLANRLNFRDLTTLEKFENLVQSILHQK